MIYIWMDLYRVYGDKQYNLQIPCVIPWVWFCASNLSGDILLPYYVCGIIFIN